MTRIGKIILASLTVVTGCNVLATWDPAFREQDRRDAADRELARIILETAQDRRDAEIVAALVGRR